MHTGILQSDLLAEDNATASAFFESIRYHAQLGSAAINSQRFADSVKHLDWAIDEVNQNILAVLFAHRAQSFENLQQYDKMLVDARQVIKCFPTSAHGHILTARALYREEQYRDALLVYDTGLNTVAAANPLYHTMVSLKQNLAAEVNERNVRFLKRLPYDILSHILSQLPIVDRIRCTQVCKGWRETLLNWHDLWATMDLKYVSRYCYLDFITQKNGRHVRELYFDSWYDQVIFLLLLYMLPDREYNQLRKLDIPYVRGIPREPFVSFLELNCESLTTLALKIDDEAAKELLATALKTCHNVRRLKCENALQFFFTDPSNFTLPDQPLKLTHLQFLWRDNDVFGILETLLSHCPNLKSFATAIENYRPKERQDVISLVDRTCPSLLQFHMVKKEYLRQHPDLCFTDTSSRSIVTLTGTQHFEDGLLPMLSRRRSTLETLRLNLRLSTNVSDIWSSIASLQQFQRLREIDFTEKEADIRRQIEMYRDISGSEDNSESEERRGRHSNGIEPRCKAITSIVRQCPLLERVILTNFHLDNDIFESLGALRHLRCLKLFNCEGIPPMAIDRFFQRAATLEHFSYQEFLTITWDNDLDINDVFRAISKNPSKSLKELRLSASLYCDKDSLEEFVQRMQDARLSTFTLYDGSMYPDVLEWLLKIPSIRRMRLENSNLSPKLNLQKALESRKEPICIVINSVGPDDQEIEGVYIKTKEGNVQYYPND